MFQELISMTDIFLRRHGAHPDQIRGEDALTALLSKMEEGLAGRGNIPMIPAYLPADISAPRGERCIVLDAGGTNLRIAEAVFDEEGAYAVGAFRKFPMPGSQGPVSKADFFRGLAKDVLALGKHQRVGFCFSYNVDIEASLDGKLIAWCKEIDAPEVVGVAVGSALKEALGYPCRVHVLNDSVAAMLGAAEPVKVGVILGTGVNVCYREPCDRIGKLPKRYKGSMIVSTEVGEFRGITPSTFEADLIAATDDPTLAQAEKQCSGGYLGENICRCWDAAAREGLLPESFLEASWTLAQISGWLAGEPASIPENENAKVLAKALICRAAKIGAVLCAGPILRCSAPGEEVPPAVEGSQYWRLTGFREAFHRELEALIPDRTVKIVKTEESCLRGAALAAFAEPMEEA